VYRRCCTLRRERLYFPTAARELRVIDMGIRKLPVLERFTCGIVGQTAKTHKFVQI